jgi:hypothetical protein
VATKSDIMLFYFIEEKVFINANKIKWFVINKISVMD